MVALLNKILVLGVITIFQLHHVSAQSYQLTVDPEFKYRVIWNVDFDNRVIHFELLVETQGFVGFGVSLDGKMKGADLLVASEGKHGMIEVEDLHGVGETEKPVPDNQQDWIVTMVLKNGTHTNLNFFRAFETGDDKDDVVFRDGDTYIVWAYSPNNSQVFRYQGDDVKSGMFKVNLFNALMGSWLDHSNHTLDSTSTAPTTLKTTTAKKGTSNKKGRHNSKKEKISKDPAQATPDPGSKKELRLPGSTPVSETAVDDKSVHVKDASEIAIGKMAAPGTNLTLHEPDDSQVKMPVENTMPEKLPVTTISMGIPITFTTTPQPQKFPEVDNKLPEAITETAVKITAEAKKDDGKHNSAGSGDMKSSSKIFISTILIIATPFFV